MRSIFAAPLALSLSFRCFLALAPLLAAACGHVATGGLTPVPTVHHAARDVAELSILLRDDATVTATDPAVLARATQAQAGPRFRESMTRALEEAGFHVVRSTASAWDVEAKIRLEANGRDGDMRQVYRLTLVAHDGKTADEVVWEWPKDTLVALDAVHDFASHHMANALGDSRRFADFAAATAPGRATAQRTGEGANASNGSPSNVPPGPTATRATGAAFVAAAPQPAAYALVAGLHLIADRGRNAAFLRVAFDVFDHPDLDLRKRADQLAGLFGRGLAFARRLDRSAALFSLLPQWQEALHAIVATGRAGLLRLRL